MTLLNTLLAILTITSILLVQADSCANPPTQSNFDKTKYTGLWYEVGRTPAPFESGLVCVTLEHQLLPNGSLTIRSGGRKPNGDFFDLAGVARIASESEPARLAVQFPTSSRVADYWVVETDYTSFSIVFTCADRGPKGITRNIFVLSRTPTADANLPETLFQKWQSKLGFSDTDTFITHEQEGCTYQHTAVADPPDCELEIEEAGTETYISDNITDANESTVEVEHEEGHSFCAQTTDPQ